MSATDAIVAGTCGYDYYDPGSGWQSRYESKLAAYSERYPGVEINTTFYGLPRTATVRRWRREAADGFRFTMKAWQGLTHPWSSPTWNSYRDSVPEMETDALGYLRPTEAVREAWKRTRRRAVALEADVVVLQTPPSFGCSDEHAENMRDLLSGIDRDGFAVAWEPRGDWNEHRDRVAAVCDDLDLIHVVDLLREDPTSDHPFAYVRLHGLNDDQYDYDYEYADDELETLAGKLRGLADSHDRVYCMFNNYNMYEDCDKLLTLLCG